MNYESNTTYYQVLCAIIAMGLIAYSHTIESDDAKNRQIQKKRIIEDILRKHYKLNKKVDSI